MANEKEQHNTPPQSREERRARRQQSRRRKNFRIFAGVMVLAIAAAGIVLFSRQSPAETYTPVPTAPTELPEGTQQTTEPRNSWQKEPKVIHIAAAGDLNITDRVIWSGQSGTSFDYTEAFMDVVPILSGANLSMLNFEGNLIGPPYGTETTSAPVEMVQALKNAGVDILQMANSCSVNNGMLGLTSSLNAIRSVGIEPVGAYASNEEFRKSKGYTICTVDDVTIAIVAFTKGVGGLGMPSGSEECVNLLYNDYFETYKDIDTAGITSVLKAAQSENPDITIAMLHWGSEYNDALSDSQTRILNLMKKNGVDVIIGTHPHMVHKIDYEEATGFLCAYSLGDFFGDGSRSGTNYSIILDLTVTKDYDTNTTRVTDYQVTPIYILAEDECDNHRRVVRLENAVSAYELNYVDKVTPAAYQNMTNAMTRIADRLNPVTEEEKK